MRVRRHRVATLLAVTVALVVPGAAAVRAQHDIGDSATIPSSDRAAAAAIPAAAPAAAAVGRFRRLWFEQRPWYEPLIADPRGAQVAVTGFAVSNAFPFSLKSGPRPVWALDLGKEIPVAVRERGTDGDVPIPPGAWGFGYWIPVSLHVVGDLKEKTKPILNTDYRFGIAFKLAHGLTNHPRDRVSFKALVGHESSHVGDEFLIRASAAFPETFDRVDVTYQFLEGGVSWDRVVGARSTHQMTLRLAASHTLPATDKPGYYVPVTANGRYLTLSTRNFEPGFGMEYVPLAPKRGGYFFSVDVRQKTVYDYLRPPGQTEQARWSYSWAVGFRSLVHSPRGTPELILRGYYGVNPNGQFRTQPRYWMIGAGVHVRV